MPKQAFFNFLFSCYAPFYPVVARQFSKARLEQFEKLIAMQNNPKPTVLLIGGGDGLDIAYIPEYWNITYLDAAKNMKRMACKKYKKRENLSFIHQDFLDLETLEKFDIIALHFVLSVTENPYKVFKKAATLLSKNGVISVLDVFKPINTQLNWFTKWTMVNLKLDVSKLNSNLKVPLSIIYEAKLHKFKVFGAYIFK